MPIAHQVPSLSGPAALRGTRAERWTSAVACIALAAVLLYAAGFAPNIGLHNAAHDARHAAGFPCN